MICNKCDRHHNPLEVACPCTLPKSRGIKNHYEKDTSPSGATRNKIDTHRHDLLVWEFLDQMASVMAEGAKSHGEDGSDGHWKNGFENEGRDIWNHVHNHHRQYREGDKSEPHLAKMAIGIMFQWYFDNGRGNDATDTAHL